MNLEIKVSRHDKNNTLGNLLERSFVDLEELCQKLDFKPTNSKIEVHLYEDYSQCDLFPSDDFPVLKDRDGNVPMFSEYDRTPPLTVVAEDILKKYYPTDAASIYAMCGHEIAHDITLNQAYDLNADEWYAKLFDATAENGESYSAGDTHLTLHSIYSEGLAEDIVGQLGLTKGAVNLKARQIQDLTKQGELSKYEFIGLLYFPVTCQILAKSNKSAKKIERQFWDLAKKSKDIKTCTHNLNFYKSFVDTIVSKQLYKDHTKLINFTIDKIAKKHFF